jgi:hypothetical protein
MDVVGECRVRVQVARSVRVMRKYLEGQRSPSTVDLYLYFSDPKEMGHFQGCIPDGMTLALLSSNDWL